MTVPFNKTHKQYRIDRFRYGCQLKACWHDIGENIRN